MRRVLKGLAAAAIAWALAAGSAAADVTVFAAASLKEALDDVGQAYEARTGVKVRVSYAATSAIARQIEQGAPADVFVSADAAWMDYLEARRLIDPASRVDLLGNRLALIAPAGSKAKVRIGPGMALAPALGRGRLALAGPDVPAGRYARAALTALGAWPAASGRLVEAENVRAALQYVARGEAPLGVVYETDAKAESGVRIVGLFPPSAHPPIVYPAALTKRGASREAAGLLAFMRSAEAARLFRRRGFAPLARGAAIAPRR